MNYYAYADNDPVNQSDPSGLCPFCIGAAIGFAADLGTQLYLTGHYDYRQGIAATVAGGLTGGASAVIGRTLATVGGRALANAAVGAAVNATQTSTLNSIEGTNNGVQASAILGGVFGAAGSVVGDALVAGSAARSQANFNSMSTAEKLAALNFARDNPGLNVGGPSAAAVATANVLSNAVGDLTGLVPTNSVPSLIPSANGATAKPSAK